WPGSPAWGKPPSCGGTRSPTRLPPSPPLPTWPRSVKRSKYKLLHSNYFYLKSGIDFKVKCITLNGTRVKLQIWDTAGQERFHTLSTSYFRGAQGFVLVYDITNLDSFQGVTSWMKDIHEKAGDEVDIVLLGNKCDKESERVVPKHKGEKLAWEHGIPFFETSAKDNVNIEDAFSVLTKEILEKKSWVLYDLDVVDLNESKKRTCCAF
uniref:small monomeric GTPase n=1 Tax=Gallus gallus TaxID=9031 RepID=A0A8V0XJV7_CHICK